MKEIVIVCFLDLEDLPPIVTLLKELTKHAKVKYIGINAFTDYYDKLFEGKVEMIDIRPFPIVENKGFLNRMRNHIYWRVIPFYYRKVVQQLKEISSNTIVWFLHEYTVMNIGNRILQLNDYFLTMYELNDHLFDKKNNILKECIKKAKRIIVPEYARAAIVQACVGITTLPIVLPNKPYDFDEEEVSLKDNEFEKIAQQIHDKGKKIVLYSGIFLRERKLETFVEAINRNNDKYVLVLMGKKTEYLDELLDSNTNIVYAGFYKAPKHLDVVKYADIGILTYVSDNGSINPVFCAPNKIWEYAKYGIPMICNDIPGLKYSVEYNKIGLCCDINDVNDIVAKLDEIVERWSFFSDNSKQYYSNTNIEEIIKDIIEV